jgi:hypothetical protein
MFLLQILICGSENYCSEYGLSSDNEDEERGWQHYFGHLKSIISSTLIETSISCRILSDSIENNCEGFDIKKLLVSAIGDLCLGEILNGKVTLNLRESFNKIVHATEMTLAYDNQENDKNTPYEYWNGFVELEGSFKNASWLISLDVFSWSKAVQNFMFLVENQVDFYHMYKHDY